MSFETIGGNSFTRHPKYINHVQKDIKNPLSVIIILGKDVNGGKTVLLWNDYKERS